MNPSVCFGFLLLLNLTVFAVLAAHGGQTDAFPRPRVARSLTPEQRARIAAKAHAVRPGEWTAGKEYSAGETCAVAGTVYVCLKPHTSQPGWQPPASTDIWRKVKHGRDNKRQD